ncbi:proteoglycan 4-like isoform X3 [Engraulis encrasicolus]|uniref:proteoglycan 4-like isoform X3 n=1 Tax=Engraulis encrasicolus TaxID=184585 RepID=UPI002FD7238D
MTISSFCTLLVFVCVTFTFCSAQLSSCAGRCGEPFYRGHLCHCDYDCLGHEECCSDFEGACTTSGSCKGRCGEPFKRGRQCNCDADCVEFKQCCPDYKSFCDADADELDPPMPEESDPIQPAPEDVNEAINFVPDTPEVAPPPEATSGYEPPATAAPESLVPTVAMASPMPDDAEAVLDTELMDDMLTPDNFNPNPIPDPNPTVPDETPPGPSDPTAPSSMDQTPPTDNLGPSSDPSDPLPTLASTPASEPVDEDSDPQSPASEPTSSSPDSEGQDSPNTMPSTASVMITTGPTAPSASEGATTPADSPVDSNPTPSTPADGADTPVQGDQTKPGENPDPASTDAPGTSDSQATTVTPQDVSGAPAGDASDKPSEPQDPTTTRNPPTGSETVPTGQPTVAGEDGNQPLATQDPVVSPLSPDSTAIPTDAVPTKPGETPSKPGETPSKPGETPSKPGETPSKPDETPSKPGETPSKPGETPSKPGETPSKPGETPSKPVETPSKPGETPSKPGETPSKPGETPSKPGETPSKPGETPSKPGSAITIPGLDNTLGYQSDDSNDTNLCSGRPINGLTTLRNGTTVVFRGHIFWMLDSRRVPSPPQRITDVWGIPSPIDTVFTRCNCQGKTYFLKGRNYWRFENDVMDPGYPKAIRTGFDGLSGHITAALSVPAYRQRRESVYFFKRGGRVQKYSYDPLKAPKCGNQPSQPMLPSQPMQPSQPRVHYAVLTRRNRRQAPAATYLGKELSIKTSWRGFPTTVTSAVSMPSRFAPDGYNYYVFSRTTHYNIKIDAERPKLETPITTTTTQTQGTPKSFFNCPKNTQT